MRRRIGNSKQVGLRLLQSFEFTQFTEFSVSATQGSR